MAYLFSSGGSLSKFQKDNKFFVGSRNEPINFTNYFTILRDFNRANLFPFFCCLGSFQKKFCASGISDVVCIKNIVDRNGIQSFIMFRMEEHI